MIAVIRLLLHLVTDNHIDNHIDKSYEVDYG